FADASDRPHVYLDPRRGRTHAALAIRALLRRGGDPVGHAPGLGRAGPRRQVAGHQRRTPRPGLPRCRCRDPSHRALRLASRARPLNDVLGALGALDRQLYLGIGDARNPLLAVLAIALTYLNYNGLIWWVGIVALARARGIGRRGIASAATVVLGLADAWIVAELLKFVFA